MTHSAAFRMCVGGRWHCRVHRTGLAGKKSRGAVLTERRRFARFVLGGALALGERPEGTSTGGSGGRGSSWGGREDAGGADRAGRDETEVVELIGATDGVFALPHLRPLGRRRP